MEQQTRMEQSRYKIITIGDIGSGKSSLLLRIVKDIFHLHSFSTIGINFQSIKLKEEKEDKEKEENNYYYIDFMDTSGQERFRSIIPMYFRKCCVILLVLDVSSDIIKQLLEWLDMYDKNKEVYDKKHILHIIFNKSDLFPEFKVSNNIINLIERYEKNYVISITSCKNGNGISELKNKIILEIANIHNESKLGNKLGKITSVNITRIEKNERYDYYSNVFNRIC